MPIENKENINTVKALLTFGSSYSQ